GQMGNPPLGIWQGKNAAANQAAAFYLFPTTVFSLVDAADLNGRFGTPTTVGNILSWYVADSYGAQDPKTGANLNGLRELNPPISPAGTPVGTSAIQNLDLSVIPVRATSYYLQ